MISTQQTFTNAVIDRDKRVLKDIHLSKKNIAIYQRDTQPFNGELDLSIDKKTDFHSSGNKSEILSALHSYCTHSLPHCPMLLEDVSKLLMLFENITEASSFRLQLSTVSSNMCRKFHTDINDLRLLCTYVGPGTLWLPDEAANFLPASADKRHEMVIDEGQIQQVDSGDVVLLKGALYPKSNPILHRSPSIEESGIERLLLRIDTNELFG